VGETSWIRREIHGGYKSTHAGQRDVLHRDSSRRTTANRETTLALELSISGGQREEEDHSSETVFGRLRVNRARVKKRRLEGNVTSSSGLLFTAALARDGDLPTEKGGGGNALSQG